MAGEEPPRRRLFVGVEIPDVVQDAVDAAVDPWREAFPGARWVPRVNRHVTLRFLGWTPPALVEDVAGAVRATAAATGAADLALAAGGRFPARGRARVLWIGLDDPEGALAAAAARLEPLLPGAFEPESRPFTAHLTVARAHPTIRVPAGWDVEVPGPRWSVDHLTLFESHLGLPYPRYEPLERCAVANVADPGPDPR